MFRKTNTIHGTCLTNRNTINNAVNSVGRSTIAEISHSRRAMVYVTRHVFTGRSIQCMPGINRQRCKYSRTRVGVFIDFGYRTSLKGKFTNEILLCIGKRLLARKKPGNGPQTHTHTHVSVQTVNDVRK